MERTENKYNGAKPEQLKAEGQIGKKAQENNKQKEEYRIRKGRKRKMMDKFNIAEKGETRRGENEETAEEKT